MFLSHTISLSILCGLAMAQSTSMANTGPNSTIVPSSIDLTLRSQWCQGQTNTCGTLCSGDVMDNDCDPDSLEYKCTCNANSSSPGLIYYKETMPTFICETIFNQCIKAGEDSQAAQVLCTENEKKNCGHLNPETFVKDAPSSSTPTDSPSNTDSGTAPSSSTSEAAAPKVSPRNIETGALAIGIIAALSLIP